MTRVLCLAAACTALVAAGTPATAQLPTTTPATPAKKAPARLTHEGMEAMLTKMGLDVKPLGKTKLQVRTDRSVFTAALSTDGTVIWMEAWFHVVTRPELVPAPAWRNLLVATDAIAPGALLFNPKDKKVWLAYPFPNENVTPAAMQTALDSMDDAIARSEWAWKQKNFVPPATEAGAKEVGKLAGTWTLTAHTSLGRETAEDVVARRELVIENGRYRFVEDGKVVASGLLTADVVDGVFRLDAYSSRTADLGIARVEGDTLTWCFSPADRPTGFGSDEKSKTTLVVATRKK